MYWPGRRPNQGPDYYKFRKILGEHALRYMDENPIAAMRLSDPGETRIHTVSYELTDEERTKAGNNDYQIRGTIGLLWRMNETLRISARRDMDGVLWRAVDRSIEELLVPFCALCDGAGMSYRTIRKHPHVEWEKYQKSGLRISSDRDFNTTSLWEYGIVTAESHRIDLENFERAADFASEGYPDDDFNAMPGRGHARLIPGFATPLMPDFGGDLTKDYLVAGYRTVYDRFKANPPEGFEPGIVRKWITLQLLAILDERISTPPTWSMRLRSTTNSPSACTTAGRTTSTFHIHQSTSSPGRSRPISGTPTPPSVRSASGKTSI